MLIRNPATRRAGTSLVEVLVGFGILGIGVTSVITLFPFSALTLGQALKDDRTTTCAVAADGQVREVWARVVEQGEGTSEPCYRVMDNPGTRLPAGAAAAVAADSNEPSFPVLIDPMGVVAGRGALGDFGETGIPRVNFDFIQKSPDPRQLALRHCSLLDSLTYDEDGRVNPGYDMRELRYNWLWVLQRPVNRDRFTARMQVVVFNQRAHLYRPPGSERVYSGAAFTPGETFIRGLPADAEVRRGGWVMDATIGVDPAGRQLRHAEFYRVVSVVPGAGGTISLEVHKPVARADGLVNPPDTSVYRYSGQLVWMPGVADVFDRPPLTASTTAGP